MIANSKSFEYAKQLIEYGIFEKILMSIAVSPFDSFSANAFFVWKILETVETENSKNETTLIVNKLSEFCDAVIIEAIVERMQGHLPNSSPILLYLIKKFIKI